MESSERDSPGWKFWAYAPLDQSEREKTMSVSIRIGDITHVSDNATVRFLDHHGRDVRFGARSAGGAIDCARVIDGFDALLGALNRSGSALQKAGATMRRIMSTRSGSHLARKNGRSKNKGRRRVGGRLVGRG